LSMTISFTLTVEPIYRCDGHPHLGDPTSASTLEGGVILGENLRVITASAMEAARTTSIMAMARTTWDIYMRRMQGPAERAPSKKPYLLLIREIARR